MDTTRSGEECGESSFDVTTYLLVDRPTHPYKQGLLERNRNNLYPKGLGSDRVSLGYYLPAVRFAVCIHTCSWHCHVTRAFSFHANARCVVPSVLLLRNQSTAVARHDHCVSFLLLCFPIGHRDCEFLHDSELVVVRRLERNLISMEYSIKYLMETFSFELSRRIEKLELDMFGRKIFFF